MIVLIGTEKGGTGKTTIATNLAAMRAGEGRSVLLLDTDVQGSAFYWHQARSEAEIVPPVACERIYGRVDAEVKKRTETYDDIVIDSGGRDSEELRSSMLAADVLYIPLYPSQFDLWAVGPMLEMYRKALAFNSGLQAFVLINRVSTNPSVTEAREAAEALENLKEIPVSSAMIRDRISFRKAVREGRSVAEMRPRDSKAVDEITALYKEIYRD